MTSLPKIIYSVTKYLLLFFLASLMGWLYEVACVYVMFGVYVDRGVLHLPACPIYGFGMLLLYAAFHKVKNPLIIFAGSALISTVIEYVAYEILYYGFNLVLWSYEPWPLNYKGKVSVISSCLFGLMTVIFMKLAVPPAEKLFDSKTDSKAKKYAAAAVAVFYIFCIGWEIFHFGR